MAAVVCRPLISTRTQRTSSLRLRSHGGDHVRPHRGNGNIGALASGRIRPLVGRPLAGARGTLARAGASRARRQRLVVHRACPHASRRMLDGLLLELSELMHVRARRAGVHVCSPAAIVGGGSHASLATELGQHARWRRRRSQKTPSGETATLERSTGKKTPGGAGTHTGHARDTRRTRAHGTHRQISQPSNPNDTPARPRDGRNRGRWPAGSTSAGQAPVSQVKSSLDS